MGYRSCLRQLTESDQYEAGVQCLSVSLCEAGTATGSQRHHISRATKVARSCGQSEGFGEKHSHTTKKIKIHKKLICLDHYDVEAAVA